ncbi:FlgO family outer membrane protein [Aliarcobacter skirrowii]|uniref:FlgO family outer membrane protein n=1 Tax=Aliarcobacter skirrowii TaxID=28200 RepID=UPI0021B17565|nr:FlgO family outer membrane protein [Aliarcobacter skirrowii]MCT7446429.1 FlgO family outer membrane protein [Aliarcobacter skirrowii]MDX3959169.1 FlgO family outer membrane protein [Aliarcobacter skirrowii]MDX4036685.1 FlgO family outer membrane protein [Aliarcobacter skirrowii]MDX4047990.1 FlgO family outer membrane protein [Aliarcobacter skirrowii]MDX4064944.1 FlgO family outer membrane protein [Aliarcobacter skirrowii]
MRIDKMPQLFLKKLGLILALTSFSFFLVSCSYKNPITKATNFHLMITNMVDKPSLNLSRHIYLDDVVLVSDFVNVDNLKNRSELGFLLSNMLKDTLASKNIITREVELTKEFEFGKSGLNVLTREHKKILSDEVDSRYALVGSYSITSKTLNIFIKLIELRSGNIVGSAFERTQIDDEILNLEGFLNPENQKELEKEKFLRENTRRPLVL